jgi:hypothetical protein
MPSNLVVWLPRVKPATMVHADLMNIGTDELPYVDEHRVRIEASREVVWTALRRYVNLSLRLGEGHPLAWLLGTVPRSGFDVSVEVSYQQLGMAGRHRFARYLLRFDLAGTASGETVLVARTFADFPGIHGQVYRALVIGTRAHMVAVRGMLRTIRRSSLG